MYPHERSLVKQLEGKPFVLLGVNSDPRTHLRDVIKKEKMTWRSWWDGGTIGGPIATAWSIEGWPTLVLVDGKGMIRQRYVGFPGAQTLDKAINDLLRELPSPSTAENEKSPAGN